MVRTTSSASACGKKGNGVINMKRIATHARTAFTLVELLVAMGIIIALAALTAAFVSTGAIDSQRLISSADRTSGWLIIAKNRALRDQTAHGVRFFINADGTSVTEAQYIEQPQAWNPNLTGDPNGARIDLYYHDTYALSGSAPDNRMTRGTPPNADTFRVVFTPNPTDPTQAQEFKSRVIKGTFLVLPEFNRSYYIESYTELAGPPIAFELTLRSYPDLGAGSTPMGTPTKQIYGFGFQAPPQPLLGETPLEIPSGSIIDYRHVPDPNTNTTATTINVDFELDPVSGNPVYFDILFAPSGRVLNNSEGYIVLWIRDPEKFQGNPYNAYEQAGEQVLIVVYTRSGYVSTQPIKPPPYNLRPNPEPYVTPHDYVTSGVNTGTGF